MAKKKDKEQQASNDDFLKNLMKSTGNPLATIASEGALVGDTEDYISTGSYILNAQISGSMYGGIPGNRITIFAGEEATGKTFYTLAVVKHFLDNNPNGFVTIFETEGAISKKMLIEHGIDPARVGVVPVGTVEDFRNQAVKVLDQAIQNKLTSKKPYRFMFVADSLGNMTTEKATEDAQAGSNTRDMTRPGTMKGTLQLLCLKLATVNAPMICTNWIYTAPNMQNPKFPIKEMAGGSGPKYVASTIVFLSRSKQYDSDKNVTGSIIRSRLKKSRFTKPDSDVETLLDFHKGLNAYFGLIEFGVDHGIFNETDKKVTLSNGMTAYKTVIYRNPEKYFTPDVMELLEATCKDVFPYQGTAVAVPSEAAEAAEEVTVTE